MPKDPRIDTYIAEAAPFARPILEHLRALVHRAIPAVDEAVKWSMPFFVLDGAMVANMAAFKAHVTFGFWHKDMKALLGKDGSKSDEAMGSLGRITSIDDLPSDAVMVGHLKKAAELARSGKPGRVVAKAPKPALAVPPDLATALASNAPAAANFETFTNSHRREYIEWITEAKRPETRAKRIATTVEWAAEGRSRNWKYESC